MPHRRPDQKGRSPSPLRPLQPEKGAGQPLPTLSLKLSSADETSGPKATSLHQTSAPAASVIADKTSQVSPEPSLRLDSSDVPPNPTDKLSVPNNILGPLELVDDDDDHEEQAKFPRRRSKRSSQSSRQHSASELEILKADSPLSINLHGRPASMVIVNNSLSSQESALKNHRWGHSEDGNVGARSQSPFVAFLSNKRIGGPKTNLNPESPHQPELEHQSSAWWKIGKGKKQVGPASEPGDCSRFVTDPAAVTAVNLELAVSTIAQLQEAQLSSNRKIEQLLNERNEAFMEARGFRKRYAKIKADNEKITEKRKKEMETTFCRIKLQYKQHYERKYQEQVKVHTQEMEEIALRQKDQLKQYMGELKSLAKDAVKEEYSTAQLRCKEDEVDNLQNQIKSLQEELTHSQCSEKKAKEKLAKIEIEGVNLKQTVETMEQEKDGLLETLEKERKNLADMKVELQNYKTKSESCAQKIRESVKSNNTQTAILEERNKELQRNLVELSQDYDKLQTYVETVKQKKKNNKHLSMAYQIIEESDSASLRKQLNLQTELGRRLEEELKNTKAKIRARAGVLKQTTHELQVLREENASTRAALKEKQDAFQLLSKRYEALKHEAKNLKGLRIQENHANAKTIVDLKIELTKLHQNGLAGVKASAEAVTEQLQRYPSPVSSLGFEIDGTDVLPWNSEKGNSKGAESEMALNTRNPMVNEDPLLEVDLSRICRVLAAASEEHDLLQSQLSEVVNSWTKTQEMNKHLKQEKTCFETKCQILEHKSKQMVKKHKKSQSMMRWRSPNSAFDSFQGSFKRTKSADSCVLNRRHGSPKAKSLDVSFQSNRSSRSPKNLRLVSTMKERRTKSIDMPLQSHERSASPQNLRSVHMNEKGSSLGDKAEMDQIVQKLLLKSQQQMEKVQETNQQPNPEEINGFDSNIESSM